MTTIISWNVNGIRAAQKRGFLDWLRSEQPDILCIQESKANADQLDQSLLLPDGYKTFWHSADRKGYSGVAAFVKKEPLSVANIGVPEFDSEGRVLILEYEKFTVLNAYFPNSQGERARLPYKLRFNQAILDYCNRQAQAGKNIILCGDYNVAHKPIDLAHPKANENNAGYYIEERQAMDKFLASGYIDTFRHFCQEPNHYTWWSYRARAREKNVGWRIDYFCVNQSFLSQVKESTILSDIYGSDHCPIKLVLD